MDLREQFGQGLGSMRSSESGLVSVMTPRKLDDYSKRWGGLARNHRPKLGSKTPWRWHNGGKIACMNSKKAQDEQRVILYIDESACYLLPLLAHTWAPRGQTPLLIEQAGRTHLSLIAAIAPNGRLYVAGQDQPFTSEDIVASAFRFEPLYDSKMSRITWRYSQTVSDQPRQDYLNASAR